MALLLPNQHLHALPRDITLMSEGNTMRLPLLLFLLLPEDYLRADGAEVRELRVDALRVRAEGGVEEGDYRGRR